MILSAFAQTLKELRPGVAPAWQALLVMHQHSPWAHHLLAGLTAHPIFQKAVEIHHIIRKTGMTNFLNN